MKEISFPAPTPSDESRLWESAPRALEEAHAADG